MVFLCARVVTVKTATPNPYPPVDPLRSSGQRSQRSARGALDRKREIAHSARMGAAPHRAGGSMQIAHFCAVGWGSRNPGTEGALVPGCRPALPMPACVRWVWRLESGDYSPRPCSHRCPAVPVFISSAVRVRQLLSRTGCRRGNTGRPCQGEPDDQRRLSWPGRDRLGQRRPGRDTTAGQARGFGIGEMVWHADR